MVKTEKQIIETARKRVRLNVQARAVRELIAEYREARTLGNVLNNIENGLKELENEED